MDSVCAKNTWPRLAVFDDRSFAASPPSRSPSDASMPSARFAASSASLDVHGSVRRSPSIGVAGWTTVMVPVLEPFGPDEAEPPAASEALEDLVPKSPPPPPFPPPAVSSTRPSPCHASALPYSNGAPVPASRALSSSSSALAAFAEVPIEGISNDDGCALGELT